MFRARNMASGRAGGLLSRTQKATILRRMEHGQA